MSEFLPFALPDIGEEEIAEVVDSLRSGWLTTGPKTRLFEEQFSEFLGGTNVVAVNSATAGLHLVLEALGITEGDEVITTPYTFTATAEVIRYVGAHPVFVDIDPNTFNINPAKIIDAITPKTKAIIPVHFAGLPCDMEAILDIARKYNLKVIEDAAHAIPTKYWGARIGTLQSDAAVFSFYATKTMTTGEGGMIATRHPEIAERCKVMRLHGISKDAFNRYVSKVPAWYYEVIAPGFKYNMTDIASSIGIHQLKKVELFARCRRWIASQYNAAFENLPVILPPNNYAVADHSWHLYALRLTDDSPVTRETFIELMAQKGIGCSVHFIPLHMHPYWRDTYSLENKNFPEATEAYRREVSLPIYTKMSQADVQNVISAVCSILQGDSC